MKKWMAALLVFVILMFTGQALAEGVDLSTLSDDELVGLMKQIQEEMVARNIEGTANLKGGKYVAGRDLPAGSYIFTCLAQGDDWGNVTIYADQGAGSQLFWEVVSAPDEGEEPESFFITLNKDDELESSVPFTLTIYTGVRFN